MRDSLSNIHPEAKIAEDVIVEAFVSIDKDVEIGAGTWIGPNVSLMGGTIIGEKCRIFHGSVIGAIPQDLKFDGEKTNVIIGNNTTIREHVTINRGTKASGKTIVGDNCLIMAGVHIAHDCIVGNNVIMVNHSVLGGHVNIDDYAVISANVLVHQFSNIGAHSMVSGSCLVRKDIPPYIKVAREPISFVGINSIGLQRRGFTTQSINNIQNIYNILFQQKHSITKALEIIEKDISSSPELENILSFIKNSNRGILKGFY